MKKLLHRQLLAVITDLTNSLLDTRKERDEARQCARVLAHAWDHDTRPPELFVKIARQWGPRVEVL